MRDERMTPSAVCLHSGLNLLSPELEGIPDAVRDRRWRRCRSPAGSSSLEFIDVHRVSSLGPDKLHPPTPSKSLSRPTLVANANPAGSGTNVPWSEMALPPLLRRFLRL